MGCEVCLWGTYSCPCCETGAYAPCCASCEDGEPCEREAYEAREQAERARLTALVAAPRDPSVPF